MRIVLTLPEMGLHPEANRLRGHFLRDALEGAIRINERIYRTIPELPSVFRSNIRFRPEPPYDYDMVPDIITMLRQSWGDCAPLAAARAGELRAKGETKAGIKVYWRPGGRTLAYHAQVRRADGRVEDIARRMGMVGRVAD